MKLLKKEKYMQKKKYNNQLEKILPFTNYKGTVLTKLIGGWEVLGVKCLTMTDVDKVIDNSFNNIKKSL